MDKMVDQVKNYEQSTKSSMEEVNQFLHTVHQDLENFLRKHKKEHTELNMKTSKLSEVAQKTLDNVDQVKGAMESYATILTCLLEFNSIEQALAYQEEIDRNKFQLKGGALAHQASKELTSAKRSNVSLGSLGPRGAKHSKHDSNFFPTYQTLDNENLPADDSIL